METIVDALITRGFLWRLINEYDLPQIGVDDIRFLILQDGHGKEIEDLRDIDSNEAAAQTITRFMREKTNEPGCRLHCSISGGRKTLSYFMGVAFQLFARQWDKLYHVLVPPEFELNDRFYYKPKVNEIIEFRRADGTIGSLSTDDADVSLVELPLVYLRNKMPLEIETVRDLVTQGQRNIDSATVQLPIAIDLSEQRLCIGTKEIKLIPTQLMIYTAFLRIKMAKCLQDGEPICMQCNDCFLFVNDFEKYEMVQRMADDYQKMFPANPFKRESLLEKWNGGMDPANIRHHISKINRALKEQLKDATIFPFYRIESIRKYAMSRYGVRVAKDKISIV